MQSELLCQWTVTINRDYFFKLSKRLQQLFCEIILLSYFIILCLYFLSILCIIYYTHSVFLVLKTIIFYSVLVYKFKFTKYKSKRYHVALDVKGALLLVMNHYDRLLGLCSLCIISVRNALFTRQLIFQPLHIMQMTFNQNKRIVQRVIN